MQFLLDEHMPRAIADGLRRRGVHVSTISEAGLRSAGDDEILVWAATHRYVVVTSDADFIRLHRQVDHDGIVWCNARGRSVRRVIEYLVLMSEIIDPDEMRGTVEYISHRPAIIATLIWSASSWVVVLGECLKTQLRCLDEVRDRVLDRHALADRANFRTVSDVEIAP